VRFDELIVSRDEILYHAKIHPEQYSNTLSGIQVKQLHASIYYVCSTAVELLADSDKFPKDWLFKHRWSKGKKTQNLALPNGNKITFLTVGGRTSAVVPAVQKKTGPVAKELDDNEANDEAERENIKKPVTSTTTSSKRKIGSRLPKEDQPAEQGDDEVKEPPAKKNSSKQPKPTVKKVAVSTSRKSRRSVGKTS
jgi:formamidopyrimidine-DNA glycosylase